MRRLVVDGVVLRDDERDILLRLFAELFEAGRLPSYARELAKELQQEYAAQMRAIGSARNRKRAELPEPPALLFSPAEAGSALGVSDRWIRRLCKSGRWPIAKHDDGWRIPAGVLDEWKRERPRL